MKYTLILSFLYTHYRKKLHLRLFSDDYLVDDLFLDRDINHHAVESAKSSSRYRHMKEFKWWYPNLDTDADQFVKQTFPEKIFAYEIDESVLGKQLRIEIKDHSTNSTNGFMTKSNMIMVDRVFLFPKCVFECDHKLKRLGEIIRKNPNLIAHTKPNATPDDLDRDNVIEWPGNGIVVDDGRLIVNTWHGGVKTLTIPLSRKFGIYFLHPCCKNRTANKPPRWYFNPDIFAFDEIYKITPNGGDLPGRPVGKVKIFTLQH